MDYGTAYHHRSLQTQHTLHLFLYFTAHQRGHTQRSSSLIPPMTCVQCDRQQPPLWPGRIKRARGPSNDNLVDEGDNSVT
jgi:hypothetical protein